MNDEEIKIRKIFRYKVKKSKTTLSILKRI